MAKNLKDRTARRKQKLIEEEFLEEIPIEQRESYRKTVELFTASTIYALIFKNLKGESLVNHLVKTIPKMNGYEEGCKYPKEELEAIVRRYAEKVEATFKKITKGFG